MEAHQVNTEKYENLNRSGINNENTTRVIVQAGGGGEICLLKAMHITQVSYVMRVLAIFWAAARCCNTANSSLTIDGKHEILNKRIGSVQF